MSSEPEFPSVHVQAHAILAGVNVELAIRTLQEAVAPIDATSSDELRSCLGHGRAAERLLEQALERVEEMKTAAAGAAALEIMASAARS